MAESNEVRIIAIIGSGVMGTGIAAIALLAGYKRVILNDINFSLLKNSRNSIETVIRALENEYSFKEYVIRHPGLSYLRKVDFAELKSNRKSIGVIADGCTVDEILGNLICKVDIQSAVSDADFVIEAAPEILELKQEIFRKLSEFTPPHTICASNTSTLLVSKIGQFSSRPEKVIGMHHHGSMQVFDTLVEIMGSDKTADKSLEIGKVVGESFPSVRGKRLVVCLDKEIEGFIANRIAAPAAILSAWLLDQAVAQGITFEQLHAAGYSMLGWDYVGLDTALNSMISYQKYISPDFIPSKAIAELVRQGRLGRKVGHGIFEWDESGQPIIKEIKIEEKTLKFLSEHVDYELNLASRLNEACRLLEMGIVKGCGVITEIERIGESHEGIFVLGYNKYKEWAEKLEAAAGKLDRPYLRPCKMMSSGNFKKYH